VIERGGRTTITQTCWADFVNSCADDDVEIGDTCLVVDYEDRTNCCGRVIITLNQIQQLFDTIPPIFDFCYPTSWLERRDPVGGNGEVVALAFPHDEVRVYYDVEEAIRNGGMYYEAREWEESNPTIYNTGSHECGANIYVPDVTVSDNCSGVKSVRAVFHHLDGGVKKIELELTNTEIVPTVNGRVCTLYTYSHTRDPIHIPFNGCDGNPIEVVYSASDGCNESTWSKFVMVRDDVPPTVVTNRDVNVTMNEPVKYVEIGSYDEGSWDNCAIELRLSRRTDWASNTSIIDL